MAANQNSTQPTAVDVAAFVRSVEHPVRRRDAERLVELMSRVSGRKPTMWGPTMVGFGTYHYQYDSGREGDTAAIGFAPRKAASTIYLTNGVENNADLLSLLGPHTTGKGCLYVKDLDAVDLAVLEQILDRAYDAATGAKAHGQPQSAPSSEGSGSAG